MLKVYTRDELSAMVNLNDRHRYSFESVAFEDYDFFQNLLLKRFPTQEKMCIVCWCPTHPLEMADNWQCALCCGKGYG